jgi:hypothetical protein
LTLVCVSVSGELETVTLKDKGNSEPVKASAKLQRAGRTKD